MRSKDEVKEYLMRSNSLSETTAIALSLPAQIAAFTNDKEAVEECLNKLWELVLKSAEQTPPEQQAYLVDVVRELKNVQGETFALWNTAYGWEQLPLLGPAIREKWNTTDKNEAEWVNINAFAARLTAADVWDFSLYCIWTVREALEDPEESRLSIDAAPTAMNAVTVWIEYALDTLTSLSLDGKTFQGKVAKPGKSLADKEWRGFCEERWYEWARRLDRISAERPDLKTVLSKTLAEVRKK